MALQVDLQLVGIGGLIRAKLGADECRAVHPHQLVGPPPKPGVPFLELYRQGGSFSSRGHRGQRVNRVRLALNLYAGPQPKGAFTDAFARLAAAAVDIDEVLLEGDHPDWHKPDQIVGEETVPGTPYRLWDEDDEALDHSFGIETLQVEEYELAYAEPGDGTKAIYPALLLQAVMTTCTRNFVTAEPMTRIDGALTLDAVSEGTYGWRIVKFRAVTAAP
jgi:hypothetical protein